jgi:hypothetical protein
MLATGRVREVFNIENFVKMHPNIFPALERLRKDLNVLVLQSRCPVNRALNANTNNDEQRERPQLSSQTFWTTFKSWIGK